MRVPFAQVDVFADRPFAGNPAAVLMLEAWPDDDLLRRIAAENNLSETAFLVPDATGRADHELRWFTPTVEVRLCGHGTLAAAHVVLGDAADGARVRFRTRWSGVLVVERNAGAYRLTLPALRPVARPLPAVVAALGVAEPVATLWHEGGYAVVVLADAAAVRAVAIDRAALIAAGEIMTIVTAREGDGIVSRVFVPAFGFDEDPVTGSAHAVLAPWWAERLGRAEFHAEQASARGGRMRCRVEGGTVAIVGACVTVIDGYFMIA